MNVWALEEFRNSKFSGKSVESLTRILYIEITSEEKDFESSFDRIDKADRILASVFHQCHFKMREPILFNLSILLSFYEKGKSYFAGVGI